MLVISRKLAESVVINDDIALTVVEIRGDKVRLGITCPKEVPVFRQETFDAIRGWLSPELPQQSPEELAFLRAVREDPDDEGIRLIFADWLDEHGDPRGEFIRIQCQRAKLPSSDPQRKELETRERTLWDRHSKHWRAYLPPILRTAVFERGFVESVDLTVTDFLAHAEDIFAAAPVRRLRLKRSATFAWNLHVEALAASPYLALLSQLDLRDHPMHESGAMALATSPHADSLALLLIRSDRLGIDAAQALRTRFRDRIGF